MLTETWGDNDCKSVTSFFHFPLSRGGRETRVAFRQHTQHRFQCARTRRRKKKRYTQRAQQKTVYTKRSFERSNGCTRHTPPRTKCKQVRRDSTRLPGPLVRDAPRKAAPRHRERRERHRKSIVTRVCFSSSPKCRPCVYNVFTMLARAARFLVAFARGERLLGNNDDARRRTQASSLSRSIVPDSISKTLLRYQRSMVLLNSTPLSYTLCPSFKATSGAWQKKKRKKKEK